MKPHQSISPLHTTHLDSAAIRSTCGQLAPIPQCPVTHCLPLLTPLPLYSPQLKTTQEGQSRLFPERASGIRSSMIWERVPGCDVDEQKSGTPLIQLPVPLWKGPWDTWSSLKLPLPKEQRPISWGWGTVDFCCGGQRCRAIVFSCSGCPYEF